jgi:hypothetical protein
MNQMATTFLTELLKDTCIYFVEYTFKSEIAEL